MKKIDFPIALVFISAMVAITAVNRSQAKYSQTLSVTKSEKAAIPDHIFYGETLSLLAKLKNVEDYQEKAGLTDEEAQRLLYIAEQCANEIAQTDAAAQKVIANAKLELNTTDPRQPPRPPQILSELQKQRDAIVLKYRDLLHAELGDSKFGQFREAAKSIVNITISPVQ